MMISSSLSLDTVEEQPQGFLMTVDRPVQIFKDALSPMMAFVTLLRRCTPKRARVSSTCRFPTLDRRAAPAGQRRLSGRAGQRRAVLPRRQADAL
ncbi:hypothetical protein M8494_13705 [Serratia ureilytica]